MVGIESVYRETKEIFDHLAKKSISFLPNTIVRKDNWVGWASHDTDSNFIIESKNETAKTYLHWLATGNYSAVLSDGAILQVSYDFESDTPIKHRLAYVPSPLLFDFNVLAPQYPIDEYVKSNLENSLDVLMKTQVRFDFDANLASQSHPETHLTINSVDCRIACASPLRVGRFIQFVFKNFYPLIYQGDSYLQGLPKDGWFDNRFDPSDSGEMHFHWPLNLAGLA